MTDPNPIPAWRTAVGWIAYVGLLLVTFAFLYAVPVVAMGLVAYLGREAMALAGRAPTPIAPAVTHRMAAYGWLASVACYACVFGVERMASGSAPAPVWSVVAFALIGGQMLALGGGALGTALWFVWPRAGTSTGPAGTIHALVPFAWAGFFLVQLSVALH